MQPVIAITGDQVPGVSSIINMNNADMAPNEIKMRCRLPAVYQLFCLIRRHQQMRQALRNTIPSCSTDSCCLVARMWIRPCMVKSQFPSVVVRRT